MKALIKQLNKLKSELIGIEMSLDIVDQDFVEINNNLAYLHVVQSDLIYNLKFLRQDNIVAIMASYNQSIKELKEVQDRIIKYRYLRSQIIDKNDSLINNKKLIEQELKQMENEISNDKVVLLFRKVE